MNHFGIIICTEKGYLEKYSLLLVRSLRQFGGKFAEIPVYSFSPRRDFKPSKITLEQLSLLNVEIINDDLNERYINYPLANKPIICAWAEKHLNHETLIFMDSDQVILNEPNLFEQDSEFDVSVRVVDKTGIGNKISNELDDYWGKVVNRLNIELNRKTITTIDHETIWGYWNSGLIISKRECQLYSNWLKNFEILYHEGITPKKDIFYLEQSCLSATIHQLNLSVSDLPNQYNYPISLLSEIPDGKKISSLEKIVSIHYHHIFKFPLWKYPFVDFNDKDFSIQYKWLKQNLKTAKLYPQNILFKLKKYLNL